ncbi:MAG: hypothetical protein H0W24_04780 [Lysobacter sp.]|jgi:hypothetical protein|nr:hypothetical protein [Lysobacter sp.]
MSDVQRHTLLEKLTRGLAYAVPAIAIVVGGSAFHAIASDAGMSEGGYKMAAVGEGEAEAGQAEAEAGHAEAEAGHAEAEAEAKPEAEAEAQPEAHAEAHPEAEADAGY